jgi:predicted TIM-barrel fold metal-dependent hydrolase
LRDNETDGVAGSVLYPTEGLQLYQITDSALFAAICRAYNEWLAEFCRTAPCRLKGVAMLPVDDIDEGIAEMRRAVQIGLGGALIPTAQLPHARYDNPKYEPLWSTAEELDIPLSLHLGANRLPFSEEVAHIRPSYFTTVDYWVKTSLADIIFAGVFDRHPRLKIGCIEHELGWIPHFLERMDYTYTQRQGNRDYYRFNTGILPSDFFRANVFCSFQDDALGIRERYTIGVEGLTWGSDYPHTESTFPRSREIISERLKDLPPHEQEMIAFGNLRRIYRFKSEEI